MSTSKASLKRIASLLIGAAMTLSVLSACNTIGGAGADIKSVGGAIEKEAE
tara:strand:- start:53 stop:205 length:153 start_codon:yes stop_codon:yes gene_type:complete